MRTPAITLSPFVCVYPLYDMWACGPISRYAPQLASYFHPLHQIPSYPWYPSKLQHTLCWANTSGGWYSTSGVKKLDVFYNCIQMYSIWHRLYSTVPHHMDVFHITFNSESEGFNFARWGAGARQGTIRWRICNIYSVYKGKNHVLRPSCLSLLRYWCNPFSDGFHSEDEFN